MKTLWWAAAGVVLILALLFIMTRVGEPAEQETTMTEETGIGIEVFQEGTGDESRVGDTVGVHYTGTLTDGTVFDSSIPRGTPFSFRLGEGRVIAGWEEGVKGMKVGEKRRLTIPPEYGYGAEGTGNIPPNATLIFEVELLSIN